jgi:hypothetical protein
MDNRLKIIIAVAVTIGIALLIGGFVWLRSRDVGTTPAVNAPTTGNGAATAPPTSAQQTVIDELNKAPLDTDGDLIPDSEESAAGTNPNNPDTDGDGVLDGYEKQQGTDPLTPDAPRVEIAETPVPPSVPAPTQALSDRDRDGLTDEQEATRGTNPDNSDTDTDGLSDLEEIVTYRSDPLKADTDNDGFNDGQEVKAKYNPLGPGPCVRETCIP